MSGDLPAIGQLIQLLEAYLKRTLNEAEKLVIALWALKQMPAAGKAGGGGNDALMQARAHAEQVITHGMQAVQAQIQDSQQRLRAAYATPAEIASQTASALTVPMTAAAESSASSDNDTTTMHQAIVVFADRLSKIVQADVAKQLTQLIQQLDQQSSQLLQNALPAAPPSTEATSTTPPSPATAQASPEAPR